MYSIPIANPNYMKKSSSYRQAFIQYEKD